jgi:hypothetical protein
LGFIVHEFGGKNRVGIFTAEMACIPACKPKAGHGIRPTHTQQKIRDAFQSIAFAACVGADETSYVIYRMGVDLGKSPQLLAVTYAKIYNKFFADRAIISYFEV